MIAVYDLTTNNDGSQTIDLPDGAYPLKVDVDNNGQVKLYMKLPGYSDSTNTHAYAMIQVGDEVPVFTTPYPASYLGSYDYQNVRYFLFFA